MMLSRDGTQDVHRTILSGWRRRRRARLSLKGVRAFVKKSGVSRDEAAIVPIRY